jgi:sugar/nucleoside kinase (ribokinase family)
VVVGAASRDLTTDDPRGWRLGGAVAYASLTIARLGLRVAAILGADPLAAGADELDELRSAGVDLHVIPLRHGPVFENRETSRGRSQRALDLGDKIPPGAVRLLGTHGEEARGWFLGPVADELPVEWATAVPASAQVAVGWQGLLRSVGPDGQVEKRRPAPSPLLRRADLVAVGRDDLMPETQLDDLSALVAPQATLVLTHGARGGLLLEPGRGGARTLRRYSAVPSAQVVDATGAGDTFLAALFAARLEPRLVGGGATRGLDVLLAAAVASLVVEAPGLGGVPSRSTVRDRMHEARLRGRSS